MQQSSHRWLSLVLGIAVAACGEATPQGALTVAPSYDGKNRALSFDGLNDYATTGTAAFPIALGPQTVALWVRPVRVAQVSDGGDGDADVGADDRQSLVVLRKDFDSGMVVGLRNGTFEVWGVLSQRTYVRATARAEPLVWQYVTYTSDQSKHRLFVNGTLVDERDVDTQNRTPTTAWLGSLEGSSQLFVGEMDEVRVYNVALPDAAVEAQAARGRSIDSNLENRPSLVLWLGFDEVAGHKAFDRSGLGNDALLGDGIIEHMPDRLIDP